MDKSSKSANWYPQYVLGLLIIVYIFNFIDRQILSILNEDIKADLGFTDAQMGFLYGTVFAVFYAVFGIPLAKLADNWHRMRLISVGLGFWSAMTALSGTAKNFGTMATYRIGVGVGEASATPAAVSVLSDYFSPKIRATIMAIYSSGIYIGAGLGLFLGGWVVDSWNEWYPVISDAPFGLKGWQAAFFVVGLPGIALAFITYFIKEPVRGVMDGITVKTDPHPFKTAGREFLTMSPFISLKYFYEKGGKDAVIQNLVTLAALAFVAFLLILWTGDNAQWIALAIGMSFIANWMQAMKYNDPEAFEQIVKSKGVIYSSTGFGFVAFLTYGAGYWTAPFLTRAHDLSLTEVGLVVGIISAVAGWLGVTFGGVLSDYLKSKYEHGRIISGFIAAVPFLPLNMVVFMADYGILTYICIFLSTMLSSSWIGSAVGNMTELVSPRLRSMATAFYILCVTFLGLALGPYMMGKLSTYAEINMAYDGGDALRFGVLASFIVLIPTIILFWLACKHVPIALKKIEAERNAANEMQEKKSKEKAG